MIKQYITQALAQLRQQPIISAVSIIDGSRHFSDYARGDDAASKDCSVCSGEQPR